jgi:beta-glucanase (GH16 family)
MTANYHYDNGGGHVASNYTVPGYWCDGFHTYGLHRKANGADFYFDGRLIRSITTHDDLADHELIFNTGHKSGRTYGAGAVLQVDYVRVWDTLATPS